MALQKCDECGHDVSTQAKTCPSCGAKMPQHVTLIGAILVIGIIGTIAYSCTRAGIDDHAQLSPLEADQKFREVKAAAYINVLKKSLNDPESLQISQMYMDQQGGVMCMEYRARNAFNALILKHMIVNGEKVSEDAKDWNGMCGSGSMYDMTAFASSIT